MHVYSQQTKQYVNKVSQTLSKCICYSLRLLPLMMQKPSITVWVYFCFKEVCLQVLVSLATAKEDWRVFSSTIEKCNFFIHWIKLHI